jgi:ubiquinone/menaquinone biosynthesis C-methylase UbiE
MMAMTAEKRRIHDDRHFDRWARRYDRSLLQPVLFGPVHASVVATTRARLAASAAVLDIGCGTGRLLERLGAALPDGTLVGLDQSAGMAQAAKRLRPRLTVERGIAEALPHRDGAFDAVFTTVSFHHWTDKPAGIAEVFRVLRPGGLFALTDISRDDLPSWPAPLWALARRRMHDMPRLEERQGMVEAAGFRIVAQEPTLHRRWVVVTLAERPDPPKEDH